MYFFFLLRPLREPLRTAAPCAALVCLAGLLSMSALSPVMHEALPEDSHGHTAICRWVKDAQICHPRSAHTHPPVLTDAVCAVPRFWLFMGLVAGLMLTPLQQRCRFWLRTRAPPLIPNLHKI